MLCRAIGTRSLGRVGKVKSSLFGVPRRSLSHPPPAPPRDVQFQGVFPILATPFHPDETVDYESLHTLVAFMANQIQVNGVTILGVLGEANRVTDKEREEIIRTAVGAAAGRIPVIVGTSHPGTKATIELSLMAQELGARGVMVTPSREPTPSDQKVLEYFQRVGEGIAVPIVLQDHPASTLVHMPVPLVAEIINSVPRVACLKAEAVPTAARIAGMKKAMRRECKVLCGLGALYGGFELKAGCDGFMTGFAFPEVLQLLVELTGKGDWEEVERIYGKFLRLIVYEQQPGVAIRKEFLRRRGLLKSATVRHPGGALGPGVAQEIEHLLKIFSGADITVPIPKQFLLK